MTTLRWIGIAVLALGASVAARGEDIKSQAESWGLQNEQIAILRGKVVDVACELAGDCPANCGGGTRQLGILKADGALVAVSKNGQPLFNGAIDDLVPFCNKTVDLDGLFAGADRNKLFQVQFIREVGTKDWVKAERWTQNWIAKNPGEAANIEEWFHHDPRIKARIAAEGYLGLGPAADKDFIKKNY